MQNNNKIKSKKAARIFSVALPAAALAASAFLPLRPLILQLLVGVALVWFQFSLMLGIWS